MAFRIAHGPIVVLAAAVYARERFFVQKAYKAVVFGGLAQDFHGQHVMVGGDIGGFVQLGHFKLGRSDFVVPRFRRDAQLQQALFQIGHEGQHALRNGAEIMVFQILSLRRPLSVKSSAAVHEVGTLEEQFAVDQEIFLFNAQIRIDPGRCFISERP